MTDLSSLTHINASDLVYDAATQTCYYSVGNTVFSFDPLTGVSTQLLSVPGTIGSLALAPDGSHMLIGLTGIFAATPDDYQGTVIDITLATASDPTTYVTRHYHADNSYLPGQTEQGVYDLLITPDNQVMMTEEFLGSGFVPLRLYPLDAPATIPGTWLSGYDRIDQDTTLIASEHGRYVLIEEGNDSSSPIALYDTQAHQVIATRRFISFYDYPNRGTGDVSEAAGLVVDTTQRHIYILDLGLNLLQDMGIDLDFFFADAKFSKDGKLLYLWDMTDHNLRIYDTATWTYQGHVDIDTASNSIVNSSGAGHMTLSDDGRFMFLLGQNGVDSVDMLARSHFEQQGTAGNDTLTSAQYGDFLYGKAGNDHLVGNGGDDHLSGGDGNDTLDGGAGSDIAIFDTATAAVSVDLTLAGAQQTGQGKDTLIGMEGIVGSAFNDFLTGDSHDNYLDGGAGVDVLTGGLGNDTYVIDDATDVIIEHKASGTDTIIASISYVLPSDIENLKLSGLGNSGTGNDGDNVLTGNAGVNGLDGGAGADIMIGGDESDVYTVDNVHDVVVEYQYEGYDSVVASVDYTLSSFVENLTLTGGASVGRGNGEANAIVGTVADNQLYGMGGDDYLDGGKGADLMSGGTGHDVFYVDNIGDVVTEDAGGYGTVHTTVSFTMGANVEVLAADGGFELILIGNGDDNRITCSYGGAYIDGGAGADFMQGTYGTDTYVVDNVGDVVEDEEADDHDLIMSAINYTLGNNLEDLTLSGSGVLNGTGNELANILTGNSGDNILSGAEGNDTLNGHGGLDTLIGGVGDDIYIIDVSGAVVTENAGEGRDTELASISYVMDANIENLTLTGTGNIDATGNAGRNVLTGNAGNNVLDGGKGIDIMAGGAGNDTYYVDNVAEIVTELHGGGSDTVYSSATFSLSDNIEKLILTGTANTIATGNALNNTLVGNDGNNKLLGGEGNDTLGGGLGNDTLDGGKGIDSMKGGAGDDKYYLDTSADVVTEYSNGGTDTVQINGTYTLTANVENLIIVGSSNRFGTGNALDNHITGNSGNNTLGGADGNDIIDGGKGADLMRGGTGNDTFYVDNTGDVVSEYGNAGTDLVYSGVSFTLGGNVENLTLTGKASLNGTGNSLDNILIGNAGNNILDGGKGHDTLTGGLGADTFVFGANSGADTVSDFSASQNDRIDLSAYTHGTANTALISQVGVDTVIDLGGGNVVTLSATLFNDPALLSHIVW